MKFVTPEIDYKCKILDDITCIINFLYAFCAYYIL